MKYNYTALFKTHRKYNCTASIPLSNNSGYDKKIHILFTKTNNIEIYLWCYKENTNYFYASPSIQLKTTVFHTQNNELILKKIQRSTNKIFQNSYMKNNTHKKEINQIIPNMNNVKIIKNILIQLYGV